uniref:Uncharacterized protein n=1 Tax=Anguilla anguilla TaxID=7936 RepID=A0A0E9PUL3_ANGAN
MTALQTSPPRFPWSRRVV